VFTMLLIWNRYYPSGVFYSFLCKCYQFRWSR
jgi:hypothetical protein